MNEARSAGPLSGKVAFATGAARGLCKAIVERYLRDGANVLAFDHHEENLQNVIAGWHAANPAWGERVLPWVGDVRNRADIQAAVDATVARWGQIDILANVAGVAREDHFLEIEPESWQRIIDINLTGSCRPMPEMGEEIARSTVPALRPVTARTEHELPAVLLAKARLQRIHLTVAKEHSLLPTEVQPG